MTVTIKDAEIREHLRERSVATLRRRTYISGVMTALCWLAITFAAVPLVAVIYQLLRRGIPVIVKSGFFTTLPQQPTIFDANNTGGVSNALVGSLAVIVYAALFAVPIGVLMGVYLAESTSKFASLLRIITATMVGAPSILMGLFAFEVVVQQMHVGFSIIAGSFGLAVLVLPVLATATEIAIRNVPSTYREAGLALGAKPSTTSLKIVLPAASTGIVSGIILALSRAVGETAPILLVIGGAYAIAWHPNQAASALPFQMFQDVQSNYPSLQNETWGIALVLVGAVFIISFAARLWAARKKKVQR
jgi:phosphate transport system permease protein